MDPPLRLLCKRRVVRDKGRVKNDQEPPDNNTTLLSLRSCPRYRRQWMLSQLTLISVILSIHLGAAIWLCVVARRLGTVHLPIMFVYVLAPVALLKADVALRR